MLFFDRYWWLRAAGAVGCGLYGAALPVWYILFVVPLDARRGVPVWADSLAAVAAVAVLFVLAVLLWRSAALARHREEIRGGALAGTHLLPAPADLHPLPSPSSAPVALPLTVRFPEARLPGALFALLLAVMGGSGLVIAALLLVRYPEACADARLMNGSTPDSIAAAPLAGLLGGVALLLCGGLLFCAASREGLVQPVSVSATEEGVCALAWWGRRRCIPWQELRMVEVSAYSYPSAHGGTNRFQVYTLQGLHGRIRWQDEVSWFGEVCEDTPELLDVMRERTGQVPRTFDRRFQVMR